MNQTNKYRKFHFGLVKYELKNISGNIFTWIFGVIFPIIMSIIFDLVFKKQIPMSQQKYFITSVFITMSLIIPLANILMGYAVTFSQEIEKDIPLRLQLFGYRQNDILLAKMIANIIFVTASFLLFIVFCYTFFDLMIPNYFAAFVLILSLYLIMAILFCLAHGFALIFRKFGPTYAICMGLYFFFMFISGMMGARLNQLPEGMQYIARLLPLSYISEDFITFWQGGTYNFGPFIQSFIFFGAIGAIVLILGIRRNKKMA